MDPAALQVFDLTGAGTEFLVGTAMPRGLTTSSTRGPNGEMQVSFSFEVASNDRAPTPVQYAATTAAASWVWVNQGCFARMSGFYGYVDSCYKMHRLAGEADPRDFYQLEQFGTVGSNWGKIYHGFLEAAKASSSSNMSWIDYSPRGDKSGSCQNIAIRVEALEKVISSTGQMCEKWNMTRWAEGGHYRQQWECGCVYPYGVQGDREIDYMQAVSVPGGGAAVWVLSAGYLAW